MPPATIATPKAMQRYRAHAATLGRVGYSLLINLPNGQLNRLALERQRKRQSELKLLLGQQISDNVNR